MIRLGCLGMGALLDSPRASLSAAQRLRVERHLSRCGRCACASAVLDAVRELAEELEPHAPRAARHERALAGAFRDAAERRLEPVGSTAPRRALAGGVAVAIVAVVVVAAWVTRREEAPVTAIEPRRVVTSEHERVLELGPARVEMSARTEVVWDPALGAVYLRSGAIDLDVEPVRDRPFRVVTDRFVVEVVGTSFRVDVEGVRVTHGTVLVRRAGSEEILRRVSAGESWRIDDDARRSARPSTAEPEPGEPGAPTAASSAASADSDVARPGAPRALDAATLLEQARRALAAGDAIAARAAAEAALAARPSRDDAAEARMLLAECAQLAGDAERAADLYLVVARRYPELAAAETASFAAARLRANAGRTDAARSLLSAYLDRYPSGRFRREATARLRALEESP